jgi:hypothetical protein
MCKFLVRLALVLSLAVSCSSRSPQEAPVGSATSAEGTLLERAAFEKGLVPAERAALDRLPDATQYRIDLRITDDLALQGQQQVRYTNREQLSLEEIYLRLLPNGAGGQVSVSDVAVNGRPVEAVYTSGNLSLRVPLATPLSPGQAVTLTLDFAVQVPREAGGNYGLLGYLEDTLLLDAFYPVIPVYDEDGWHAEPPPPNADASYNDASFYLVRVTAPKGLALVASGVDTERRRAGNEQVVTFAAGPARDFYLAASDRYAVHLSEKVGDVRVNSYALSGQEDAARQALRAAAQAIRILGDRLGPYVYTEFDIINSPLGALGIEYPGLTSISRALYDAQGGDAQAFLESTVAHEVAHQWFYNVVGNDQPGEPWLDEALAQYLTGLYYRDARGQAAEQSFRASWESRWARVERADIPIGLPAGKYVGREYGAIVYGRGPLFFEALADKMGQPALDALLRDYYQTFKWEIATTEGFKQLAQEHCQCDLTPLFQEWVYAH